MSYRVDICFKMPGSYMLSGKGQSENVSFNVMLYKISESRIKIEISPLDL